MSRSLLPCRRSLAETARKCDPCRVSYVRSGISLRRKASPPRAVAFFQVLTGELAGYLRFKGVIFGRRNIYLHFKGLRHRGIQGI